MMKKEVSECECGNDVVKTSREMTLTPLGIGSTSEQHSNCIIMSNTLSSLAYPKRPSPDFQALTDLVI